jgi:hypothetical protein
VKEQCKRDKGLLEELEYPGRSLVLLCNYYFYLGYIKSPCRNAECVDPCLCRVVFILITGDVERWI